MKVLLLAVECIALFGAVVALFLVVKWGREAERAWKQAAASWEQARKSWESAARSWAEAAESTTNATRR